MEKPCDVLKIQKFFSLERATERKLSVALLSKVSFIAAVYYAPFHIRGT